MGVINFYSTLTTFYQNIDKELSMELTIEQALQQGIAAHKEGNIQEAERLYHAILQSQPAHADANHNLGVIAVSINKTELALSLFKTALEANPKVEQFWLSYIDTLIKETQFETAIAVLQQGKKMGLDEDKVDALEVQLTQITQLALPTQSQIDNLLEYYQKGQHKEAEKLAVFLTQQFSEYQFGWKVLGAVLSQTGRLLESLDAKQIAVQLAPLDAEAHSNLGITLLELRRLDEAEASYTQAIVLKPDYSEAHNNLGITLQELGRLEEAEASCRQAIEFKPDFAEAHNNLGNPLRESGRLEEAEAAYRQAIVLKPDYSEAHNNLGATLQELDRLEEAEASHRQAIAWKPDYAEAHSNLGIALQELDRLEEAETSFKQALALKPDYTEAHSNLGNTLQELGRLEEAEASYTQAIALKSDFPDAHYNLGNTLKMLGRLEKAEASYRKAIVLKPDYADSHYNLGITLQELGRLKEAEASYRRAIALQPDYAEAHNNLANTLKELNRLDEAETSCRRALSLKMGFFEANRNLASILRRLGRKEQAIEKDRYAIFLSQAYAEETEPEKSSDNLPFKSPSAIEYPELYRAGMGTENTGGFLRAMAQMLRPKNILEIGAGYTTPFLLEALVNNERAYDDGNLQESYFQNYIYDSKLVVIDNMSLGELRKKPGMDDIISSKYTEFIQGSFEGKAELLHERYGDFDFVWFDCGGIAEYKSFMVEYWDICSDYIFFHFTYTNGNPNDLHEIILNNVTGNPSVFDIVEPHKSRQGSITMVRKND